MNPLSHSAFRGLLEDIKNPKRQIDEHISAHHVCKEGENFVDCYGQESPGIAVIKNNTGSDTGEGMNRPEQGHGQIILGYNNFADNKGGVSLFVHSSHKRFSDGEWQNTEHSIDLTHEQIKHLARHAGIKLADE